MADVGDEVFLGLLNLLNARDVMQHGHRSATGHGAGVDLENPPGNQRGGTPDAQLALSQRQAHTFQHFGVAHGVHQRLPYAHRAGIARRPSACPSADLTTGLARRRLPRPPRPACCPARIQADAALTRRAPSRLLTSSDMREMALCECRRSRRPGPPSRRD